MIAAICLFCPALMSVGIYEALTKVDLTLKRWVYLYAFNLMAVNGAIFFIKTVILHTGENMLFTLQSGMCPKAGFSYLAVAVVLAVLLSLVEAFIGKNVKISLEERKNG